MPGKAVWLGNGHGDDGGESGETSACMISDGSGTGIAGVTRGQSGTHASRQGPPYAPNLTVATTGV